MIQFPKDFIWGSAAAAYQVEGGNSNSDWWPWELKVGKEPSGAACNHYQVYEQDFDLAKSMNHKAHRLSIEWARIEPEEGKFSEKELKHYIDVILALRARGIEPMVTLHHFTNPIWLSEKGGWENKKVVALFRRYSEFVVRGLAKHVHYWITINEPTIYISHSFILGWWPPQKTSFLSAWAVERNMIRGHIEAYRAINKIYSEQNIAKPSISISQHVTSVVPCNKKLRNRISAWFRNYWFNLRILNALKNAGTLDFIGVNYYSRQLVDLKDWCPKKFVMECSAGHPDFPSDKNFLGWVIYPQGLHELLLQLRKYDIPIMITENGICAADDKQRWEFIQIHLRTIHDAMQKGAKVTGYLYWSLLDNFEWAHGYGPRFGLIEMDYKTQKRTIRDSAKKFAEVCKTGILE